MSQSSGCPECRHILPGGRKCGAIASRGEPFCHAHLHRRTLAEVNRARRHSVALPPLEDRAAIQMSIDEVLAAFAAHKISRRETSTYLYALDLASRNLARMEQLTPPVSAGFCGEEDLPDLPSGKSREVGSGDPALASPTHEVARKEMAIPMEAQDGSPTREPAESSRPWLPSPAGATGSEALSSRVPAETDSGSENPRPDADTGPRAAPVSHPEPPLPRVPLQMPDRRSEIEESLRGYRKAHAHYAALPAPGASSMLAYVQQIIGILEAQLASLNQQDTPGPPPDAPCMTASTPVN